MCAATKSTSSKRPREAGDPAADRIEEIIPNADDKNENEDKKKRKRTSYACVRCRKRHIKCPGGNPCEKCKSVNVVCEYAEAEKKVVVSMKYLQKLHEEIATLKKQNANLRIRNKPGNSSFVPICVGENKPTLESVNLSLTSTNSNHSNQLKPGNDDPASTKPREALKNDASHSENNNDKNKIIKKNSTNNNTYNKYPNEIIPPFIDRQRRLVSSKTGEKFYVGSSSMTLFGLEVESMIPDNVLRRSNTHANGDMNPNERLSTVLEREGNAYRIYLGKTETRPGISVKFVLPSYSYSMLLIDTFITYNDGCFYFFNEGMVKENLRKTYSNNLSSNDSTKNFSNQDSIIETINFCKFLLIFAIGEMYLGTANDTNGMKLSSPRLPGSGFFQQASELFTGLFASGAIDNVAREGGVEVMLLYAFYLQVADCTVASYFYFGTALRASLILGLHVDVEKDTLNRYELEHRRRLWWTVYMFERMLSSKAGLPLSLTDDCISTELPEDFDMSHPSDNCKHYIFPEAEYIRNCVTIVQINALILSSLYQKEPTTNILPVIAELITKLFTWKENLPDFLKPNFQVPNFQISRLVTNIMTEYFQGINLAVRPLLFYLTTKQIRINKTSDVYIDLTKYSESILTLLNASFQGSINTIRSLWSLMPENMVALFGYMDREYLFTSAATLILFNVAFGVHDSTKDPLDHALFMFTKMKNLGNNPAELRRAQLIKLMQTLNFNNRMQELIDKYNSDSEDNILAGGSKSKQKKTELELSGQTQKQQPTFNKKLMNKERRMQVNNNRFIYQKNSAGSLNPGASGYRAPYTPPAAHGLLFDGNNIHNIDDIISGGSVAVSHPVSNTRSELLSNKDHDAETVDYPLSSTVNYLTHNNNSSDGLGNTDHPGADFMTSSGRDSPVPELQRLLNPSSMSFATDGNNHHNYSGGNTNNVMLENMMKTDFTETGYSNDLLNNLSGLGNRIDNELWDEITNQPTWLNDVSEEFQNLMNSIQ
ncbi:Put3 protein [Saccharomycopsis crataegensis]|uniref:Put3 protein n=1 Tax=Saccharomycopsis crataegensis TaxID=43959 RepID=A0AAV5QPD5_9ASCO|nr:Put3 protein [Saccharomycopsis crataegensis]